MLGIYRNSLTTARRDGKGLRIRLRFQVSDLATLPWEFLYDPQRGDHISLDPATPVVRHLEMARGHSPLTVRPPLRILGMIASPHGLRELDVERERANMTEAIRHLQDAGYAKLDWVEGKTWRALQAATWKDEAHVFHFIGHGGFDPDTLEGLVALAHEDGEVDKVSATRLGRLFAGRAQLRLVVLNSCEGARANVSDLFSSAAGHLIRQGIPAVVSMQHEITDPAALEFSRTFYDALAQRLPVDAAVTEARKAITMADERSLEFATPVLHMRSPDGHLFDIDVAGAVFTPPETGSGATRDAAEPRLAAPAAPAPTRPSKPTSPSPSSGAAREGLLVLLHKTRRYWIDDVLARSLEHSGLIELHLETAETLVESPWGPIAIEPGQTIADVFEETGGCFLILGVPGGGKTTLLLTLARDLLDRAEADPARQVPVVLNLSTLRAGSPFPEWLAGELGAKYQIPRKVGGGWIEDGRLMLLLDGLDEVGPEHRRACVESINAFMAKGPGLNIVVCSRLNEYMDLPVRLALNGAINVRQITRDEVLSHVAAAGAPLAGLLEALQRDSSLAILAQTPFMLSLMMRTYFDEAIERTPGFASIESRRQQLMEAYVHRQFRLETTP